MADKIVQVTASKIVVTNPVYSPKLVELPVPKLVVANAQPVAITTSVENLKLTGIVTNMGEGSIPNPFLFKRLNDEYTNTDVVSMQYLQTKLEQAITPDQFSRVVNYGRVFQEVQTPSDIYKIFFVNKVVATPLISVDTPALTVIKPFKDFGRLLDVPAIVLGKTLSPQVAYIQELVNLAYLKNSNETVVSGEDFRRQVDFKRSFHNTVYATDDFLGNANIDDDQTARVGKTLVNWATSIDIHKVNASKSLITPTATSEQKSFALTKPPTSQSFLSSQTSLGFAKMLSSTSTPADQFNYQTGKALTNISAVGEQHTTQVLKLLVTQAESTEQKQVNLQKPLFSNTVNSDTVIKTWQAQRQFASQTNTGTHISFGIGYRLLDNLVSSEQNQKSFEKALSTTFNPIDQINTQVDYIRSFLDLVNSTDDFFGSANIDDDQTARVGKHILNTLLPTDQHSIVSLKGLNTQYFAGEQARLQTSKVLSSTFSSTELAVYAAGKVLLSTSAAIEQQSFSTSKLLATVSTSTDTFSRIVSYNRQLTDLFITGNFVTKNINKELITPTTTTEQITTQTDFKRLLSNLINGTEQTAKISQTPKQELVLLQEQARKSTTKVLQTIVLQQEDLVQKIPKKTLLSQTNTGESIDFFKFGNRFFNEIATTNDSGVINNQGYFAESYVEPGYAGTNTNFS
jgi:dihydroneopterin aldolase